MKEYPVLSYKQAAAYLEEARKYKVSEVARSARGFMGQYKKYGGKWSVMKTKPVPKPYQKQTWEQRRANFIKRVMVQYRKNNTYRRFISLIMWGFMPKLKPKAPPS